MALRDNVKTWFETGDYPTQQQFYTLFESIWFKDEKLAITDITNLQAILNSLAGGGSITTVTQQLEEVTSTENQTAFTLALMPIGKVKMFRNGTLLPMACYTVVGKNITYHAELNNEGFTGVLTAIDRVSFEYLSAA